MVISRRLMFIGVLIEMAVLVLLLSLAGCSVFSDGGGGEVGIDPPLPVFKQTEKAVSGMPWIVGLCVIGIGVGAGLFMLRMAQIGIPLAVGSVVTLGVAIAVSQWYWLIAYVVGAILLVAVGYLGYLAWRNWRGFSEVIRTAEKAKHYLAETSKQIVFGGPEGPEDRGEAGRIQSPTTEKLVALVRAKLAKQK